MKNLFNEQENFYKGESNRINTNLIVSIIILTFLLITILL